MSDTATLFTPRDLLLLRAMAASAAGAAVILPVAALAFWGWAEPDTLRAVLGPAFLVSTVGPWQRFGLIGAGLMPVVPIAFGLWRLRATFLEFLAGRPFSISAINGLNRFAMMMIVSVAAGLVSTPLLSLSLSWNAPPGARQITLTIGSGNLALLFFACVVLVVAWALRRAAAIEAENRQFI
ncbi:DUF2975 domain-containing protein [Pannonibacter sp. P2PFMT1]|uniref:DUF2975 domain-containing protein n=1 Tax=Pannonibacter sp. P2PFMT1 TaxID=2003582 RepID=UPI0016465396|nr:DUF2975 domain-containing protein [Pannonibacter sp. P2PFMT1]